ncbi:siroheme synthase CysG [Candidatus Methylospira mobilis]|uniref:siroheme synthase CysG n=1 Tax=Candidatus Methylospira mobilis TaxID=1808979 RepID=UPI0028E77D23|nr:siroheme synthase CysG [Candidatus Methylospira mobilis]WNV05099.1 siroheme synthase CysG [Candidatus Methylospira mobilis]
MDYFPVFLKITGENCLVAGGGKVALRKMQSLLRSGGRVTLVSSELCCELTTLSNENAFVWLPRQFEPNDVEGCRLVIAATDDAQVNQQISAVAHAHNIPVNVVDCPELCSFIMPAVVDRSPVVVALSSGGGSPLLTRLLKAKIENLLHPAYSRLAELAERNRRRVKAAIGDAVARRRFWEALLQGSWADMVCAGRDAEAQACLEKALCGDAGSTANTGMVYLVGAGPGDPELLTLRALRLIQEADVIVYDRLVSAGVMARARLDAEKIYAGKQRSRHSLPQNEINHLLVELACQGKRVVRLKGGDPFIFGRGGEEIETLMEQGIPFQVVPGITAASGCAAYAGIPLTHRDYAQSCLFITGHLKNGEVAELDWKRIVNPAQTLVIYMGLHGLRTICETLIRSGCSPNIPAALIQQGTTPEQRVITGELESLAQLGEQLDNNIPTLIIIGEVVSLHDRLSWFGR